MVSKEKKELHIFVVKIESRLSARAGSDRTRDNVFKLKQVDLD